MKISISRAAQDWGVSRTTIYQKIKDGELSRGSDKKIDTSEMLRVFGEPAPTEQKSEQTEQVKNSVQSTRLNSENTVQSVLNMSEEAHLLALEKLKNEHLSQQIADQKQLVEQYQRQIEQLSRHLEQANSSIHELAQTRLLELKRQQSSESTSEQSTKDEPNKQEDGEATSLQSSTPIPAPETSPIPKPNSEDTASTTINPIPKKRWWQFGS